MTRSAWASGVLATCGLATLQLVLPAMLDVMTTFAAFALGGYLGRSTAP